MGDKGKKDQKKKKKAKSPARDESTISTALTPVAVPNKGKTPSKR